jgi:phosphoglycerate dehydrogenase-like enzyme
MQNRAVVCLPYRPQTMPRLPAGPTYRFWDASGDFPGDPGEVTFFVPPVGTDVGALRAVLPYMRNLEVLQLLGSGLDHLLPFLGTLPADACVCDARGVHSAAAAELAVTLLLASLHRVDRFAGHRRTGRAQEGGFTSLAGKTVLIVGYGAVGSAVEERVRPFGGKVVRLARSQRRCAGRVVHAWTRLREFLPAVDAVVLCAPLTDQTRGLFGVTELGLLKDGASLVNVGGGELVDTDALTKEVEKGRVRACLGGTVPQPLPPGHRLRELPGVLITPHIAARSDTFAPLSQAFLRRQLELYVKGMKPHNVVREAGVS